MCRWCCANVTYRVGFANVYKLICRSEDVDIYVSCRYECIDADLQMCRCKCKSVDGSE